MVNWLHLLKIPVKIPACLSSPAQVSDNKKHPLVSCQYHRRTHQHRTYGVLVNLRKQNRKCGVDQWKGRCIFNDAHNGPSQRHVRRRTRRDTCYSWKQSQLRFYNKQANRSLDKRTVWVQAMGKDDWRQNILPRNYIHRSCSWSQAQ